MSLKSLVAAAPSGRARPLLIDDSDYATAVIRQGSPIPWTDVAALTGHAGQVQALLGPDAAWLDAAALVGAHLSVRPQLRGAMGARSRAGYALRTLLGDDDLVEAVATTAGTIGTSGRRALALAVPSPGQWLGQAHDLAGTPLEGIDEDRADTASMYLAEWLGRLGSLPVAVVLLDARGPQGEGGVQSPEKLEHYSSITNVAGHFDWSVAIRGEASVETAGADPAVAVLPDDFWLDGAAEVPGDGELLLTHVPATASPERVLDQLTRLR